MAEDDRTALVFVLTDELFTDFVVLAAILRRRLDAARREQVLQREAFESFSLQQADRVPAWKAMVQEFERDGTKANPYEIKVSGA